VKLARDQMGTIKLFPAANDVGIHFADKDNRVHRLSPGDSPMKIDPSVFKGVCAGPKDTMKFQVQTMVLSMFLDIGNTEGAAISLA